MVKKKAEINWKSVSITAILFGLIAGSIVYLYVDKNKPHNYVCNIVGYDGDANMLAMKCMYQ